MATKGTASGVIANMVTLVVDGPVAQNEICYISTGGDRLMAEVIKVVGTPVYVQVFESTRGLKVEMCIRDRVYIDHTLSVRLKVSKGAWRMPWLSEAMKDVISCDKLRVGANNL